MTKKTGKDKGGAKRTKKKNGRDGRPGNGSHGSPKVTRPTADGVSRELAVSIADVGLEKKALNVEVIDVRGKVDYADFVVVMSGRSDRQVNAIARGVEEEVERRGLARCIGLEGLPQGSWVLMDFGDVVVHVFHDDMRGYYDLESLWMDAARVSVADGR